MATALLHPRPPRLLHCLSLLMLLHHCRFFDLPPLSDPTRQDQFRPVSPVMTRPCSPSTDLTYSLLHHAVSRRRLHLDLAPAPPRLCFSSLLLQSASKSTIDFYLSHTPSPKGGAIERSMSSLSSSDASSPAPYTTLSKQATCEREIAKSTFIAIDFSRYLTLGDTRCRHHRLRIRFHSSLLPSDPRSGDQRPYNHRHLLPWPLLQAQLHLGRGNWSNLLPT